MDCPFCGDTDFTLLGLKHHIVKFCDSFKSFKDSKNFNGGNIMKGHIFIKDGIWIESEIGVSRTNSGQITLDTTESCFALRMDPMELAKAWKKLEDDYHKS